MSYHIWVQDLPANIELLEDIPDDFVPGVIGTRTDIIRKIILIVPFANFSDPAWGDGIFRHEDALASFQEWRMYRDQIVS